MVKRSPAKPKDADEFDGIDILGLTEAVNYARLHTGVQPTTDEAIEKRLIRKSEGVGNGDADDLA